MVDTFSETKVVLSLHFLPVATKSDLLLSKMELKDGSFSQQAYFLCC